MSVDPRNAEEMQDNLLRAEDSLAGSGEMLENGRYDIAASRAYYAAFYAARALLLHAGIDRGKHSGVIAAIQQEFVKSGELPAEAGAAIRRLFRLRSVGDYGSPEHVTVDEAREAMELAQCFVSQVTALLKKEEGK